MYVSRSSSALLAGAALLLSAAAPTDAAHPVVAGFERFHAGGADSARGGQLLLGELNCHSCHQPVATAPTHKQAPVLDGAANRVRAGWLKKFLSDPAAMKPGTTMPKLFADDPDKAAKVEALTHFLASTGTLKQERADIKAMVVGRDHYAKLGCVACHGPRDVLGNSEKNLPAYAVPLGDLKAKYTIASLNAFLADPLKVRPSGRMPHLLNAKEAKEIANYLMQGSKVSLPTGLGSTAYSYFEGDWGKLPDFAKLKPNASGIGPAFDLSASRRESNFALRFEGFFKVEKDGQYKFTLTSDDGSKLSIDGKLVVDNDGIHAPQTVANSTFLTKGVHKVAVEFMQGGGGAELTLNIQGGGLAQQPFAAFVASTEAGLDKKPEPKKEETDDFIDIKPDLVAKGKALFTSAGCANCHAMNIDNKPALPSPRAAALDKLKPTGGCLSDKPAKGLPWYALSAAQRTALAAALKTPAAESKEPAAVIARAMTTLNCYACHARDKVGGPTEETNKFFLTTQQEMGDEGRVPPPLDGVGAKLNADYFKQVLDKGADDRPYMHTRMPGFGAANIGHLPALFAALDKLPSVKDVKFDVTDAKVKSSGRHMVGEQALACIKCHTFNNVKAEGIQGIDMTLMPKRITRDWFFAYLIDPQKVRPGTRMPSSWPDGNTVLPNVLGGSTPAQVEAIWVYLKQGGSATLPLGMGKKSIPLHPYKEAIVYRNFIQGAGTRAIGVGYPEKINLAFDANDMRLALIWQGLFIDAAKHWTDRGAGFEGPLGDNVLSLANGAPFAVLKKSDEPWPTTKAKDQGYKFLGYNLSTDDRPTFTYSFDGVKVEDFPNAAVVEKKDPTLKRELKLTAAKNVENVYFRAAVGAKIESAGKGWYTIDGWKMKIESTTAPEIRQVGGKSELIVPVLFKGGKTEMVLEYVW